MSENTDKLQDERHAAILQGIHGIHDRLDKLNGRTRRLEKTVAVLSWAYGAGAAGVTLLLAKVGITAK